MKNGVGGVWISKGILPYYLNGRKLALALLLKEKADVKGTAAESDCRKRNPVQSEGNRQDAGQSERLGCGFCS